MNPLKEPKEKVVAISEVETMTAEVVVVVKEETTTGR
jgi:hypothetical protein